MGTATFNKIMLPKKWQCRNFPSDPLHFVRRSTTYKNSQRELPFWSSLWSACPSKTSSCAQQQQLQGVPLPHESVFTEAFQRWKPLAWLGWLPSISIKKARRGGPFLGSLTISVLREDTLAHGTSHRKAKRGLAKSGNEAYGSKWKARLKKPGSPSGFTLGFGSRIT